MIPCPGARDIIGMGLLGSVTPGAPGAAGRGAPDIASTKATNRRRNILMTIPEQLVGVCNYTQLSSQQTPEIVMYCYIEL